MVSVCGRTLPHVTVLIFLISQIACSGDRRGGNGGPDGGGDDPTDVFVDPLAGDVIFSVPSSTFDTPFTVSLSTALQDAEIRYTTDGQPPTVSSDLYGGTPLEVSETVRYVANIFINGAAAGTPSTVLYVRRQGEIRSDLPIIVIDDYGSGPPGEETDEDAAFFVFEPAGGGSAVVTTPSVAARAGFHVRGQTSVEFDKKNYKVELRDAAGLDADYPLLGMPQESDWVLHGPFADKSLIRNAFAYGLGRDMGLEAPRFAFAELYLNTDDSPVEADDYVGVYLLVESVKNARNRLDLMQLRDTDATLPAITGGYIFKFELDVAEPPTLTCSAPRGTPCWVDLEVYDPVPLNSEQETWLGNFIQSFHDALFSAGFTDPGAGYRPYIDLESFVDYMVLQEVTRNLDAYIRSLYLYKDRESPIFVGPLWDYNLIAGAGCCGSTSTDGWQYEIERNGEANGWFQRLMADPAFTAAFRERYGALRSTQLSDASIDARIDGLTGPLVNAAARNFQKWPNLTEEVIIYFETPTENSWEGQVEAVRSWFKARLSWLDGRF